MSIIDSSNLIDFEGDPVADIVNELPLDDGADIPDGDNTDAEPLEQKEDSNDSDSTMI